MNVLTAYIVKEILKGSSIALLVLVTLFNLFTFSDELKNLGHGSYDLKQLMQYLLLTTPTLFYEVIPSAALLGSLAVVGSMANNREIVAMRAAGISIGWIIRSIMLAGLFLVVIAVFVGEFIAPSCERAAQLLKSTAQNNTVSMRTKYGMWLREGNSFINVRKILDDGSLADLRIFSLDEQHKLHSLAHIEHAIYIGDQHWKLENISRTTFSTSSVDTETKTNEIWQSDINQDLLKVAVVSADNQSLYDLFQYIEFLKQNNQKSQRYEIAFWSRLINPLVTFVMLMISAPLVIGIGRGSSTGTRILIGIVIGESFDAFDKMVGHAGVIYDLNPVLVAIFPSILVFCTALVVLKRAG